MVNFVNKRLQVFVSSTFDDLKVERQAAVSAILNAGHIPAGMELFTAGDESQMEVIKQWIDESDIYCLILGGRYGSVEKKTGKSYTQLEYEYAKLKGKPFFTCVIKDAAMDRKVRAHGREMIEQHEPQKLKTFRDELCGGAMVRFWDDEKDIKIAVAEALAHLARKDNLVGWVRATAQVDISGITDEITRLSKENGELRAIATSTRSGENYCGLTYDELLAHLEQTGLLTHLLRARQAERDDARLWNHDYPRGLSVLGLFDWGAPYVSFSPAGRAFVNKFELRQFENGASTPSVSNS